LEILIIGGTSRVGQEVVRRLSSRGSHKVKVLVRDAVKAEPLAPQGVEIISGDVADAKILRCVMRSVDRLLVIPPNIPAQAKLEGLIYQTAKHSGVSRVVKLSSAKADENSSCPFFQQHAIGEGYLNNSGVQATILRSNSFMQNLLWFAPQIKSRGTFSLPMGDAKTAPVDLRDVAAVASAILLGPEPGGATYDITGPEELSFADMAKKLSTATGKTITYRNVAPEEFLDMLKGSGVPSWYSKAVTAAWNVARESQPRVSDHISTVIGKSPITFEQFSRDFAKQFASLE